MSNEQQLKEVIKNKKRLLISFSGGRTSAYMTWWLLNIYKDRGNYEMVVVFANTGREREETLQFVRACDRYYGFKTIWIEAVVNPTFGKGNTAKIVDFNSASRKGEVFESVIAKHGIPNQNFPHCSREMKKYPIRSFAKHNLGWKNYETAIGIRMDETKRINWDNAKKEKLVYPLVTLNPINKNDINLHWSKQPFDLKLKSYEGNCSDCWKKSFRKLLTIAKENPQLLEWTKEMEEKYSGYIPETRKNSKVKPPILFFRKNMTAEDIIEESKLPFDIALDESKNIDYHKQTSFWTEEMDSNGGCIESCEAF